MRHLLRSTAASVPADDEMPSVFVSYSRQDAAFVDALEAELLARGVEPLVDRAEIEAFEDWWARIETLIAEADTVVFVLSPDAVASDICRREIDYAASLNKRFAPVVARAVDPATVPPELSRLNFVHLDAEDGIAESLDRLAAALATDTVWIRSHSDHGARAERWRREGRPTSLLLRSPQLEDAEAWLAARPAGAPAPTAETTALILASRRAVTRRRTLLTASLGFGLVVALALAGLAEWQRQEAVAQRTIAEEQTRVAAEREVEATRQRDAAERNFRLAKSTVDDVVFDFARGLRQLDGVRIAVLRTVLSRVEATMGRLREAAPDDPALLRSRSAMLDEFGDTYLGAGDGPEAARAYEESLAIMRGLVARDPQNLGWQRDLSVSLARRGNQRLREGDRKGAAADYEESLFIVRSLVRQDGGNALRQRDLLIALNKIGDVKLAADDLDGAAEAYDQGLAIARELSRIQPEDTEHRRDLSVGLERLGDLRLRQGDAGPALRLFEESLGIRRELTQRDPDNARGQRDLSVILDRLGEVRRQAGDETGARAAAAEGLAITRILARRDPGNADWQLDLAVSLEKAAEIGLGSGDAAAARTSLEEAVGIRRALATRDPGNPLRRRELAATLDRLATAVLKEGDATAALALSEEGLGLVRALAREEPGETAREDDLARRLASVGDLRARTGDRAGADKAYEEDIAVRRTLVRSRPDDALAKAGLALRLAATAAFETDAETRRGKLTEARDILADLERQDRLPAELRPLPGLVATELAKTD